MSDLEIRFVVPDPVAAAKRLAGDMGKYSKLRVDYRKPAEATLDQMQRICANCKHIQNDPTNDAYPNCDLVQGSVSKTYVCNLFERG